MLPFDVHSGTLYVFVDSALLHVYYYNKEMKQTSNLFVSHTLPYISLDQNLKGIGVAVISKADRHEWNS